MGFAPQQCTKAGGGFEPPYQIIGAALAPAQSVCIDIFFMVLVINGHHLCVVHDLYRKWPLALFDFLVKADICGNPVAVT